MQNALGHGFLPSPPELRGQCDKAMEVFEERARRQRRLERENEEFNRQFGKPSPPLTEDERHRQRERMARFYRSIGKDEEGDEASFRERMEAKYGREALAAVPDNPGFRRRRGVQPE